MVKKARPHGYCHECGSDLGEIPPPPPRCSRCRRPVKGHKGPWGKRRCKAPAFEIDLDKFFKATIEAYAKKLDRLIMDDQPSGLATLGRMR